jgi:hypothetical protein
MAIDESALNKGEARKLEAFRKSVGRNESAAQEMFKIWMSAKPQKGTAPTEDNVAIMIEEALAPLIKNKAFKLGNKGYTVKRARGRGVKSGVVASKNE